MKSGKLKITRRGIFVFVIIIIKILIMGLFSSDYQNKLFYPFVTDFVKSGGNVYQRFWNSGIKNAFPYPGFMLLIETIGVKIIQVFEISSVFWVNFFFKLPSFLLDILAYAILLKLCPDKKRYIAVFYYASPIIIYSVYMHGQLDLIPMVWLLCSIYCLISNRKDNIKFACGAVFMALALLCKLHILAVLPIVFLYLEKRDGLKKAVCYLLATISFVTVGFIPFWSEGFYRGVVFNSEQSVLTQVAFDFISVQMYIPIAVVLLIYLLSYKLSYLNKELFINLCGIVFAVFLALCPPMPGWYVWVVPFIAVFFETSNSEKYKNICIYVSINLWYLLYFIFFHDRGMVDLYLLDKDLSFLKVQEQTGSNILFTLMSATLLYLVYSMYQIGVASNSLYKRKNIPFTIGIAGDSGVGKSTMINMVENCLGKKNLLFIEGDGDHRWERGDKNWDEYTALNPKANYLYRQAEDLRQLRAGGTVKRVDYDHSTGKFTDQQKIRSNKYVMLCGLHSLYLPQTRKNLDLKIYLETEEQLRRYWKIQRDTKTRGHSKEDVVKSIEDRMPDAKQYIYPQREFADMVVHYYDKNLSDCMVDEYDVNLSVRLTLSASVNVEQLVNELRNCDLRVEYDYSEDLKTQVIYIEAENLEEMDLPVEEIAYRVIPQIEEITRENFKNIRNGKDAVLALFFLLSISSKMQGVL